MASKSANIVFDILARDNASQTFDKITGKAADQQRALEGLRIAGTAQFVALTAAATVFAKKSVDNASDLEETLSMSTVVFGDNADAIVAWSESAARSAGLSKQSALDAAATFGDMFMQIGFTADAATDMSTATVQMAADLGSFRNLDTEDVIQRISAAMRGEYDSLQLLIPNINAARVQQEALAATGKTSAAQLTAQEKAAATLAIIHADGARAAGDFARTSDGLANSQKILNATAQNLSAEFGQKLLPAALKLVSTAVDMVEWIDRNQGAATALAIAIGVTSTAIAVAANWQKIHTTATTLATAAEWLWEKAKRAGTLALGESVAIKEAATLTDLEAMAAVSSLTATTAAHTAIQGANTQAVNAAATAMPRAAIAARGLVAALGVVGVAIAVGSAAWQMFSKDSKDVIKVNEDLVNSFDKATGALTANTREVVYKSLVDSGAIDDAKKLGVSLDDLTDAALGNEDAQRRVNAQIERARKEWTPLASDVDGNARSMIELNAIAQDVTGAIGSQNDEIERAKVAFTDREAAMASAREEEEAAKAATEAQTAATEASKKAAEDAAEAVLSLAEAIEKQIEKQREAAGIAMDQRTALRNYHDAIDEATAALTENGQTLDVTTEQGRKNQEALDDIATATWDWIEAGQAAGMSQDDLAQRMANGRQQFIDTAVQMGMTEAAATQLANELKLIPSEVVTNVRLTGYADTYAYLTDLQNKLRSLDGSKVRVAMGAAGQGGITMADGGAVYGKLRGPGTSTTDRVPVSAAPHEWFIRAAAAWRLGPDVMEAVNAGNPSAVAAALAAKGFAGGGSVSSLSRAATRPYLGLQNAGASAPSVIVAHVYDTDGVLIGTMRGVAEETAKDAQHARTMALKGGGPR